MFTIIQVFKINSILFLLNILYKIELIKQKQIKYKYKTSVLYNMNTPIILSIDGNIGSGKSTLYNDLKNIYHGHSEICFVPEPVDDWKNIVDHDGTPILTNLYKDTKKYAFRFQMMAYISRLRLLRQKVKENKYKIIISERCVQTDKMVFAQMLYDDGMIDHDEFQIYLNWFEEFLDDITLGGIIYVRAEPDICKKRVHIRGREGENIPLEYLTKCHNYHEAWLNETDIDTLVINANVDTSLSENQSIRDDWIGSIDQWISKFYKKNISITLSEPSSVSHLLRFDGACRGNPSNKLGMGCVIYDANEKIVHTNKRIHETDNGTNNIAEYIALVDGLRLAIDNKISHLIVEGDSQLVINQVNGVYKVNAPKLIQYYNVVKTCIKSFEYIEFRHIKREYNKDADRLANEALDEK